jgi:hypothetical protein
VLNFAKRIGNTSTETHQVTQIAFGDTSVSRTGVFFSVFGHFNKRQIFIKDDESPERPLTSANDEWLA